MLTPVSIFWHQITSLRVGLGALRLFTLRTIEEAAALPPHLRCRILGNGTNTIGSDDDMRENEAVIKLGLAPECACERDGTAVLLPAAMPLSTVLRHCARIGLGGLSALAGIPGTVGGALAMNAGALGHAIGEALLMMEGWDLLHRCPWRWVRTDGGFAYRQSPIPRDVLVFSCKVQLQMVSPEEELARLESEIRRRRQNNPQGCSAGSVFRNPGDGLPSAGRLLEECGCKGLTQGKLQVSQRHANWIMNLSGAPASARDARTLVYLMRQRVLERFGISLQTEWRWEE